MRQGHGLFSGSEDVEDVAEKASEWKDDLEFSDLGMQGGYRGRI